MVTYMKKQGQDPCNGMEKGLKAAQDKILAVADSLTQIFISQGARPPARDHTAPEIIPTMGAMGTTPQPNFPHSVPPSKTSVAPTVDVATLPETVVGHLPMSLIHASSLPSLLAADRLSHFFHNWCLLTNDKWVP